jgi:hypothetical protein
MYEARPSASIGVEYLWSRLDPLLWYLPDDERAMVREGLELAVAAHAGQMRKSGEPFVTHPVEVRGSGGPVGCGQRAAAARWGAPQCYAAALRRRGNSRVCGSWCAAAAGAHSPAGGSRGAHPLTLLPRAPLPPRPRQVTRILAEMRMDAESLVAGLLHDTVEDTDAVCFDDIEARFGSAVRRIVEGETKISKITKVNSSAGAERGGGSGEGGAAAAWGDSEQR